MVFFVYVLYSHRTEKMYTGHTNNLERRLIQHNSGFEKSTKNGAPWELIHFESFRSRSEAMLREKILKTGKGRDFIFRGSPPRRTKD